MPSLASERVFNRVNSWVNLQNPWIPTSIQVGGDFRAWATGGPALVPPYGNTSCSCFEMILLAAALEGARPQNWFNGLYQYAGGAQGVMNWMRRWTRNLFGQNVTQLNVQQYLYDVNGNVPVKGDIVLFNQAPNAVGIFHHVAIATGLTYNGHSGVLSFYGANSNAPTPVIRTSIERLTAQGGQVFMQQGQVDIYFARPRW